MVQNQQGASGGVEPRQRPAERRNHTFNDE
jgi:hypothetical protein